MKHFIASLLVGFSALFVVAGFAVLFTMSPQPIAEMWDFILRYSPLPIALAALYAIARR